MYYVDFKFIIFLDGKYLYYVICFFVFKLKYVIIINIYIVIKNVFFKYIIF